MGNSCCAAQTSSQPHMPRKIDEHPLVEKRKKKPSGAQDEDDLMGKVRFEREDFLSQINDAKRNKPFKPKSSSARKSSSGASMTLELPAPREISVAAQITAQTKTDQEPIAFTLYVKTDSSAAGSKQHSRSPSLDCQPAPAVEGTQEVISDSQQIKKELNFLTPQSHEIQEEYLSSVNIQECSIDKALKPGHTQENPEIKQSADNLQAEIQKDVKIDEYPALELELQEEGEQKRELLNQEQINGSEQDDKTQITLEKNTEIQLQTEKIATLSTQPSVTYTKDELGELKMNEEQSLNDKTAGKIIEEPVEEDLPEQIIESLADEEAIAEDEVPAKEADEAEEHVEDAQQEENNEGSNERQSTSNLREDQDQIQVGEETVMRGMPRIHESEVYVATLDEAQQAVSEVLEQMKPAYNPPQAWFLRMGGIKTYEDDDLVDDWTIEVMCP